MPSMADEQRKRLVRFTSSELLSMADEQRQR